ncbi:MAG: nucleotidyltransferase domain-containing protein [Terracidiphilus sp.]
MAALCRQFHVQRLELFGSALSGTFDSSHSDFDFLADFAPLAPGEYATAFFGFKDALEQLFGRPVDLVVPSAIRNPYFRRSIEQSKALLYAA